MHIVSFQSGLSIFTVENCTCKSLCNCMCAFAPVWKIQKWNMRHLFKCSACGMAPQLCTFYSFELHCNWNGSGAWFSAVEDFLHFKNAYLSSLGRRWRQHRKKNTAYMSQRNAMSCGVDGFVLKYLKTFHFCRKLFTFLYCWLLPLFVTVNSSLFSWSFQKRKVAFTLRVYLRTIRCS